MRLLRRKQRPVLHVDDSGIRWVRGEEVTQLLWKDLHRVRILTTDDGPFVDDVFWCLLDASDEGVVIGSEALPPDVLDRLTSLPGFDHEALVMAMCSAENAAFDCWTCR